MNIVAQRLKEAMNDTNLRQIDIVNKTGINKGALSSYLNGKYLPKVETLEKLSNVLNVNKLWLLGYNVPKYETFDEKKNKIKKDDYIIVPYNLGNLKKGDLIKFLEFENFIDTLENDVLSISQHNLKLIELNKKISEYSNKKRDLDEKLINEKISKKEFIKESMILDIELSKINEDFEKIKKEYIDKYS